MIGAPVESKHIDLAELVAYHQQHSRLTLHGFEHGAVVQGDGGLGNGLVFGVGQLFLGAGK